MTENFKPYSNMVADYGWSKPNTFRVIKFVEVCKNNRFIQLVKIRKTKIKDWLFKTFFKKECARITQLEQELDGLKNHYFAEGIYLNRQ